MAHFSESENGLLLEMLLHNAKAKRWSTGTVTGMEQKRRDQLKHYDSKETCDGLEGFVRGLHESLRERALAHLDPGRVVSLHDFNSFFVKHPRTFSTVGVISGSASEPELSLLESLPSVELLNFPENEALDLNLDWSGPAWADLHDRFDLVLCEQVLEHVANPGQALKNVYAVLQEGGLAHLSFPSINNRHGEPYFFYAGFAVELVEHWARLAGFTVIDSAVWSSDKGSRMYSTCDWAPLSVAGPIRFFWLEFWRLRGHPVAQLRALFSRAKNSVRYPFQALFPRHSSRNAVVSWVYLVK